MIGGAIAVGKTSIADELARQTGGVRVGVRAALADILQVDINDRKRLQFGGADLDRRTSGRWLHDYLAANMKPGTVTIVDSVRTVRQTEPVLAGIEDSRLVFLRAEESTRRIRYGLADDRLKRSLSFDDAVSHPTERRVDRLRVLADVVLDTDAATPAEVAEEICSRLNLPRAEPP